VTQLHLDVGAVAYNEIDLNWQDNSNSESGFEIWQQKEGGSWQLKSTVGANITSKDITGLEEETTYCYKVRVYSSYGNSDWSNIDCDTTPPCPPGPPEAPSNLVAYPECLREED
jgi:chitodextrinase